MQAEATDVEQYVTPEQLCIGLYVHLDLSWSRHPFTFSSFKIKNERQLATIQGLGLSRVRFSPERSDCAPLAASLARQQEAAMTVEVPTLPSNTDEQAASARRERLQRLACQHAKADACQKALVSAAHTIRSINSHLLSAPQEVRESANDLIRSIASSMLVDSDVSIQLMADKVGGEELYFHALNVSLLSMMLAKELKAPADTVHLVGVSALFHDIGELEIPRRLLRKTEPLTRHEQSLLQTHCEQGALLARKMGLPADVQQVIAQHHERVDGSGYPKNLTAAQMSLPARIISLVNAYDELCNPANAAKAMTPHEALSTMFAQQREQYDQLALNTFVRCMGVYPPGTIVVLSNGQTGMVVSVNTSKPLRPVVMVHDAGIRKEDALLVDLESRHDMSITKTLRPQQLSSVVHAYLAPRQRMTYYFDTDVGQVGA
jgi:putative nucleotidyltransferase with HDIG domain